MSVSTTAPRDAIVEYGIRPTIHAARAALGLTLVGLFGFYTFASAAATRQEVLQGDIGGTFGGVLLFSIAFGTMMYLAHLFFVRSPRYHLTERT